MLRLWGGDVFVCVDGVYGWVCVCEGVYGVDEGMGEPYEVQSRPISRVAWQHLL